MRTQAMAAMAAAVMAGGLFAVSPVSPASANPNIHVVRGTNGNDRLFGTKQSDLILGFRGNDLLVGGRKNDVLMGGFGNDVLRDSGRHSGKDLLRGGPGRHDRCVGSSEDIFIGCETVVVR